MTSQTSFPSRQSPGRRVPHRLTGNRQPAISEPLGCAVVRRLQGNREVGIGARAISPRPPAPSPRLLFQLSSPKHEVTPDCQAWAGSAIRSSPLAEREGSRGRSQARLARGVAAGRRAEGCSWQGGRCSEESEMRKKDAILEAAAYSPVANNSRRLNVNSEGV